MRRTRWLPVLGEVMAAWTMIGASADVESTGRPALLASAVGRSDRSVGRSVSVVLASSQRFSVSASWAMARSCTQSAGRVVPSFANSAANRSNVAGRT